MKRYAVSTCAVLMRITGIQVASMPSVTWASSRQSAENMGLTSIIQECPPSSGWEGHTTSAVEIPDTEETLKLWGGKNA